MNVPREGFMGTIKLTRMFKNTLRGLFYFYCAFVLLWFISYCFVQDSHWVLVGLDKFAEYFLVLSIPVLIAALFSKRSKNITLALLPIVVAGFFYLPLLIPDGGDPIASEHEFKLRVMTYNILNQNNDIDAVVNLIVNANPDLVAIQELTEQQKPDFIERITPYYPHYYVSRKVFGGTTGLFSKTPIKNVKELEFNIDRPAIFADITIDDKTVTVVSAHLNPSFWAYYQKQWHEIPALYHQYIKDQNTQAKMIIDLAKQRESSTAIFLACDCNSQTTASTNRVFQSYFNESFDVVGWQMGNTSEHALAYERNFSHIDYVWFWGRAVPSALYRMKQSAGSDHKPVVADFMLL